MDDDSFGTSISSLGRLGVAGYFLIAPLAVLLALVVAAVTGVAIDMDEFVGPLAALSGAAMLATLPRVLRDNIDESKISYPLVSLIHLLGTVAIATWVSSTLGGLTGFLFLVMVIGGTLFAGRNRNEEYIIFTFSVIGFHLALGMGGLAGSALPQSTAADYYGTIANSARASITEIFFSTWLLFSVLGFIAAILQRGHLLAAGQGAWFKHMANPADGLKPMFPLLAGLGVWAFAHALTLAHYWALGGVSDAVTEEMGLTGEQMRLAGSYVSVWWALFTGIIALIAAFCYAERWFTRTMLIGVIWFIFTLGAFQEHGYLDQFVSPDSNGERWTEILDGNVGILLWLGITFFALVLVFYISTHQKYGNWMNRSVGEIGRARKFWSENWTGLLILSAFIAALVIRFTWNVLPAMNAVGTGGWDMTGGSDPWYMKRAIDYVVAEQAHLLIDADRAYPVGDINPRPPLFTWSLALGGLILAPILGIGAEDAVWWSIGALPAIYGAFIVFPIASMAKQVYGRGAAVIAAWLIAFMPGHVSHTTFALADHDAFVLLFATVGFNFFLKSVFHAEEVRILAKTGFHPRFMSEGFRAVWSQQKTATAYAVLSGVAFATVALAWKGFVYAPSILFVFFSIQVIFNLFRNRDSMVITVLTLTMMLTIWLVSAPFYIHPALNLFFNSEFQAMFYVTGLIFVTGYIVTSARDRPWLLVVAIVGVIVIIPLLLLWLQWTWGLSDAGSTLFTGGGYFSKNKVFGTIAEAQAPSRGLLFGSFGAIVFISALTMGLYSGWVGIRHRKLDNLILAVWVFLASYMAWNAGRFVYNATPVMSVVGAGGMAALWGRSGWNSLVKEWRRLGVSTPSARFGSARRSAFSHPGVMAVLIVFLLMFSQHATYGLDAGIPRGSQDADEVDQSLYNIMPDVLRWTGIIEGTPYEDIPGYWYLNAFGPGFNDYYWNTAYEWLANQDLLHEGVEDSTTCAELEGNWYAESSTCGMKFGDRPAFVSWWDYGFQALSQGQHPTVADNFQSGIPQAGNMLLARNQDDTVALFILRLGEGDYTYSGGDFSTPFEGALRDYLSDEQYEELHLVTRELDVDVATDRMFEVYEWADATMNQGMLGLARGYSIVDGMKADARIWRVYEGEAQLGEDHLTESSARTAFEDRLLNRDIQTKTPAPDNYGASHYVVGDYWYTSDIIEGFYDPGTSIHRENTRLALGVQLLSGALDSESLNDLYSDLMDLDIYTVQDSEGAPGETITRNHEIAYFAVDTRLYPLGGGAFSSSSFNRGNPTGIFYAPTTLSGQDPSHFMETVYETQRMGESVIERTAADFDEQYRMDLIRSQSGATSNSDVIQLVDVRYDHKPAFFDTMLARAYVGYGASSLGLSDFSGPVSATPKVMLSSSYSGTPNTALENAWPMPGAMMNHFVISNWYDERGEFENFGLGEANFGVKVLKYYAGAELCGSVVIEDLDTPIAGATLLFERDGFSGEGTEDLDDRTYWIPIGTTTADENGDYCYTVPAGRIRVTALIGEFDPSEERVTLQSGNLDIYSMSIDIIGQSEDDIREINSITSLLAEVSGMMWLGENELNVSAAQAEREASEALPAVVISLSSSSVSGVVHWAGSGAFDGLPLVETEFVLENIWNENLTYTVNTINNTVIGQNLTLSGLGVATFEIEEGIVEALEAIEITGFTGNYTRLLNAGQSYTGNGTWAGDGTLEATWIEGEISDCSNGSAPFGESICLQNDGDYLLNGTYAAAGRLTSSTVTEFTTYLGDATFEAGGRFVGRGTFEGEAFYSGFGNFTGEMVVAGSFFANDIAPGTYRMFAEFENGRTASITSPIVVGLEPTQDLVLELTGMQVSGMITDVDRDPVNTTVELFDRDRILDSCTSITADAGIWIDDGGSLFSPGSSCLTFSSGEEGNISIGPLSPGNYSLRADLDQDGWYELNVTLQPEGDLFTFDGTIADFGDVTILLSEAVYNSSLPDQPDLIDVSGIEIEFTSIESGEIVNVTSNATGVIEVELELGDWILRSRTSEDLVLWTEFNLDAGELNLGSLEFAKSVDVRGIVAMMTKDEESNNVEQVLSDVRVNLRNGSIEINLITDVNGSFGVELPAGKVFDITVLTPDNQITAKHQPITEGMDIIQLIIDDKFSQGFNYAGRVILQPTNMSYDASIPGYENFEVFATFVSGEIDGDPRVDDFIGVTWVATTSDEGRYDFILPNGIYNLSVSEERLGVADTSLNASEAIATTSAALSWNIDAHPDPVTLQIRTFLDEGDGDFANGTPINVDFTLVPASNQQEWVNITADLFAEDGIVDLQLFFGQYNIEMDAQNPVNGTEYETRFIKAPEAIAIGINGVEDIIELAMEPMWRVNLSLIDQAFAPLPNTTITLDLDDGDEILATKTVSSDANGTFLEYIRKGNYTVTIGPLSIGDTIQSYRGVFHVDESAVNRSRTFRLLEVAKLELTLVESVGEANSSLLKGIELVAINQDGLGEVSLPVSNQTAKVSATLFPGNWNLNVNHTDMFSGIRWILEDHTIGDLQPNQTFEGEVPLDRFVAVTGNVFWDFNEDGQFQPLESLAEANVTIAGGLLESPLNMTTTGGGGWSFYVPAYANYTLDVERAGFSENLSIMIEVVNESLGSDVLAGDLDVMLEAEAVSVSGRIDLPFGADEMYEEILSEMVVELIPAADNGYDRQTVNATIELDATGANWSATVDPGEWVFYAESPAFHLVVYDAFVAEIIEGGEHNTTLEPGGYIPLSTRWTDFSGDEFTILDISNPNSTISETVLVTLTADDAKWNVTISAEPVTILLPAGSMQFSAEFSTTEQGMEMEYVGDSLSGISPAGINENGTWNPVTSAEAVIEFNRILVHDLEFELTQIDVNGVITDGADFEAINATQIDSDADGSMDGFEQLEFSMDLSYDGNLESENYTLTLSVAGTDNDAWILEFQNGTTYEEMANVTLGIGEGVERSDQLVFRVTPPSEEESVSYDSGHTVRLTATADTGETSTYDVNIHLPQNYSISASGTDVVGLPSGGGSASFDIVVNNHGNGDDKVTFSVDESDLGENWSISKPLPRTIPANGTSEVGYVVTILQGTTSGEYTITINVTSEDGSTQFVDVVLKVAMANLRMSTPEMGAGGGAIHQPVDFSVIVFNDGLVDADNVVVTGWLKELNLTASTVVSIPAEGNTTATVLFNTVAIDAGEYTFVFSLDAGITPLEEEPQDRTLNRVKFTATAEGGSSSIVPIIIVLIFAAGIYMFIQSRKRTGGPGF